MLVLYYFFEFHKNMSRHVLYQVKQCLSHSNADEEVSNAFLRSVCQTLQQYITLDYIILDILCI